MFTGIIEATGLVEEVITKGSNRIFRISSPLSAGFKPDQSVSHSGVCLTIEAIEGNNHQVTAIDETLQKTDLGHWQTGTLVNLERCLPLNGRLDGHFVQGHVDTTGTCIAVQAKSGSYEYEISFPEQFAALVIEKGSVSLNGISLTVFGVTTTSFRVAIIPYTFEHTNIKNLQPGQPVNIEFDLIGKYILRGKQLSAIQ